MALSKFCIDIAYVRRMRGHLIDTRLYNPGKTERERNRETEGEREIKRKKERDIARERERKRETDRERGRKREREKERERTRKRERERKVPCSNYIYASQMPPRCLRDSGSPSPVGKSKF